MWLGCVARDVGGGVLWRGFFGVMGFTHPQPNFANSIRLRKKMIPFHAIWGLCWYDFIFPNFSVLNKHIFEHMMMF